MAFSICAYISPYHILLLSSLFTSKCLFSFSLSFLQILYSMPHTQSFLLDCSLCIRPGRLIHWLSGRFSPAALCILQNAGSRLLDNFPRLGTNAPALLAYSSYSSRFWEASLGALYCKDLFLHGDRPSNPRMDTWKTTSRDNSCKHILYSLPMYALLCYCSIPPGSSVLP